MPPKKKQLKGGLFDPASMTMTLMTTPEIKMLDTSSSPSTNYSSKNYLNVPNGGGKPTQKKAKSTTSTTSGGRKPTKTKK